MLKICSQCGEEKPISDFALLWRSKDGHRRLLQRIHAGRNIGKLMLSNWLSVYQSGALSTSRYYRNYQKLYHRDRRAVCAPRYVAPFRLSADPRPFCNGNIQTRRPVRAGLHQ